MSFSRYLGACAFTTAMVALSISVTTAQLSIDTQYGKVNGVTSGDVDHWYGIRYAAEATNSLRWKAPQPPPSFTTTYEATTHFDCYQGNVGTEKGCLTVDIWAPKNRNSNEKLPVMFWIHGGSYTSATPSFYAYNGTNLVLKSIDTNTPTIVVAVTYRLGGLGFMAYKALSEESGTNSSGNYGMLDQIFALKWVQQNIENFGGDKTKVTIFGESAGSYSVCALLASPLATGLFRGAIMESAYCAMAWYTADAAYFAGDTCAKTNVCDSTNTNDPVACMRALAVDDAYMCDMAGASTHLTSAQYKEKAAYAETLPNIDGYFLTDSPIEAIRSNPDVPQVPVIIGSNQYEFMIFALLGHLEGKNIIPFNTTTQGLEEFIGITYEALPLRMSQTPNNTNIAAQAAKFAAATAPNYIGASFDTYAENLNPLVKFICTKNPSASCKITGAAVGAMAFVTDYLFTTTATAVADAVASKHIASYRYLMEQPLTALSSQAYGQGSNWTNVGCFHSWDVAFVFNNFDKYVEGLNIDTYNQPASDASLSSAMQEYWLGFAATLNPNPPTSTNPTWMKTVPLEYHPTELSSYMTLVQPGLAMSSGFHKTPVKSLMALVQDSALLPPKPSTQTTTTTSNTNHSLSQSKLSAGDDVAITVGIALVLAIALLIGCFVVNSKKDKKAYDAVAILPVNHDHA